MLFEDQRPQCSFISPREASSEYPPFPSQSQCAEGKLRVVFRHQSFRGWLFNPLSGDFHVPPNTLDLTYLRIVSRAPPPDPSRTFSRQQLIDIFHVVAAWPLPNDLTEDGISLVINVNPTIVANVLRSPVSLLLQNTEEGRGYSLLPPHRVGLSRKNLPVAFRHHFKGWLANPRSSGEFHVPPNALDILYHRILSRSPPSEPSLTFSREHLVGVLHVMVAWPKKHLTINDISLVLGVHSDIIINVVRSCMPLLLRDSIPEKSRIGSTVRHIGKNHLVEIRHQFFKIWLLTSHRSGEFHVPSNALDLLYHRILSRSIPPKAPLASQDLCRQQLIQVIHMAVSWPKTPLTINDISLALDLDPGVVTSIVRSCMFLDFEGDRLVTIRGDHSFKEWLLNPRRSGEFHVPPNALDLLYLQILSRPPPSDPLWTFTREQLVEVLHTIVIWKTGTKSLYTWTWLPMSGLGTPFTSIDDPVERNSTSAYYRSDLLNISVAIGAYPDVVRNVVYSGPVILFTTSKDSTIDFFDSSLRDFLLDPRRSGEYHLPQDARDLLHDRILSHLGLH